jgi:histidinol-phosphate/aromatic aminotransferase/cobyric acid decarboxylase-like protein
MGYLLASKELVAQFQAQGTDYRFGTLHEALAIAALTDKNHLPELRAMTAQHREEVSSCLRSVPGIEVFESHTHYIFARFTDGRTGAWLAKELEKRGILIKVISPVPDRRFDEYFRITLGLSAENDFLCANLRDILGEPARAIA